MTYPSYRRDSIEELVARTPPALRPLLQAARARVLALVPEATERLRPGWGLIGYDAPRYFACVVPAKDCVRIGFEWGVLLEDPRRLLTGSGARVRYVEIRKASELKSPALARIVRQAAGLAGRAKE